MAVDKKHIVEIDGKPFVTYAGLVNAWDEIGKNANTDLVTELMQYPTEENNNTSIFRTEGIIERVDGDKVIKKRVVVWGDANPKNCGRTGIHSLRIGDTRSTARALRLLTNTGMTCVDEIGSVNVEEGDKKSSGNPFKDKAKTAFPKSSGNPPSEKEYAEIVTQFTFHKIKFTDKEKALAWEWANSLNAKEMTVLIAEMKKDPNIDVKKFKKIQATVNAVKGG